MKLKLAVIAVLPSFLVLFITSISYGIVNTKLVDEVLAKGVLDPKDLKIIDDFLADATQDLVRTTDFTSIAKTRTIILTRQSTQAQYAQQFSESAYKHISVGLQQAGALPENRRFKVITNLLILTEGLKDPRLADLAIKLFDDKNQAVRYWAVRAVTNPGFIERVNKAGAPYSQLTGQITSRLVGLVETSSPETLALMADFAAKVDTAQAEDLLLKMADVRTKRYADWTVTYELVDGAILKSLCDKMVSANPIKPEAAHRFSQLYSYVIQRYISGGDLLSDTAKQQLASVMVDTEEKCIGKLAARPQSSIRRAVESNDYTVLKQEHDRLLGDAATKGELVIRLKFDYGQNPDGSTRASPLALPAPPKQATTQ